MKVKQLLLIIAVALLIVPVFPVRGEAESLDGLTKKEEESSKVSEGLSADIMSALDDVNAKYAEIEKIKEDMFDAEETIKQSEEEMTETQESIDRRKDLVAERMKTVQLSGNQRTWQVLLEAESVSDFFNKAYAMTVLQKAEKEKITQLTKDKERLAELHQTVASKKVELEDNESKLQMEAINMNEQVGSLKQQLSDNQELLQQISSEKQHIAEELAMQKQAEAEKQAETEKQKAKPKEQTSENVTVANQPAETGTTPEIEQTPIPDNTDSTGGSTAGTGNVFYMQSTAYSWQEMGYPYTATGIDLRKQSNVVAVDPNVIPLGSLVQVAGYGFAIAGDTGGAIKGNIIDVHFSNVEQCVSWGRRYNVEVIVQ